MTRTEPALEIHRLLDEALAGVEATPEVQDLKEEIRANLVARVAEFQADGLDATEAARRAMAELGDLRSVVDETETIAGSVPPWQRHKVRPAPAYVVRTVVLSLASLGALVLAVVPFARVALVAVAVQFLAVLALAALGGAMVGDALRQETTTNYPLPARRAAGYGAASALGLAAIGVGTLCLRGLALSWLVPAIAAAVAAIVLFALLGATQTNRHKPWVVRLHTEVAHSLHTEVAHSLHTAHHHNHGDRFSDDPAAAARFGLYTVTIWIVALTAFAVLSFTVGWAWSWLALVGGVAAMMLTLARMLFGAQKA
jgi:hypothetical protein